MSNTLLINTAIAKEPRILELYSQNYSQAQIIKILNVSHPKIRETLIKNGIKIRKKDPYIVDEDYFKVIDSHQKAYFLGLIMADGSVFFNRPKTKINKLKIGLKIEDSYILEEFRSQINAEKELTFYERKAFDGYKRSVMSNIEICNESFVTNLTKFGIHPSKSINSPFFKNVPEEFIPSAILGYFDGDGSVYFKKKYTQIATGTICSVDFGKGFSSWLFSNGVKHSVENRVTPGGFNMSIVKTRGNRQSLKFYNLVYRDDLKCLSRKRERFEFIINEQKLGNIVDTNW